MKRIARYGQRELRDERNDGVGDAIGGDAEFASEETQVSTGVEGDDGGDVPA